VLSWSILDYYGFGKAGYFYVKRAYAPVLASFKELEDGAIELWITNDTLEEVTDALTIQSGAFAKGKVWEERHTVHVPANNSQVVWQGEPPKVVARPDHYLVVSSLANRFPPNRHFFAAVKDLLRPVAEPEVTFDSHGEHELLVHVHAPAYLYYVHVIVPDEHTCFSDNYFDLVAGETRTVVVTNQKVPLTPEMVSIGWR
jgi:beta-mannosidase